MIRCAVQIAKNADISVGHMPASPRLSMYPGKNSLDLERSRFLEFTVFLPITAIPAPVSAQISANSCRHPDVQLPFRIGHHRLIPSTELFQEHGRHKYDRNPQIPR